MATTTVSMRIAFTDLAAYNSGCLRFQWVDLSDFSDLDSFTAHCAELLVEWGAEEFFITDHEGFPAAVSEYASLSGLWDQYAVIADCERSYPTLAAHGIAGTWLSEYQHLTLAEFLDCVIAVADSISDYAYTLASELYCLDSCTWASYFDHEQFAYDLQISGDYNFIEFEGGVVVVQN
jgi:antirestriction protein